MFSPRTPRTAAQMETFFTQFVHEHDSPARQRFKLEFGVEQGEALSSPRGSLVKMS